MPDQFAGMPYDKQAKTVNIDGDVYKVAIDRLDLPPGFQWEYYTCEDGGGSQTISADGSVGGSTITPTIMRRAVGPWQVHRERSVHNYPLRQPR